jgi:threonine dehydrogenase-like Zn-dependent dehydrogenase
MRALTWHGKHDIRCDTVPDPRIEDDRDAIVKVSSCAICGSDLHLYDGFVPGMRSGDVMGHECMGEVVEVAPGARHRLKVGDRVVIPFTIFCGDCFQCRRGNFSVCEELCGEMGDDEVRRRRIVAVAETARTSRRSDTPWRSLPPSSLSVRPIRSTIP